RLGRELLFQLLRALHSPPCRYHSTHDRDLSVGRHRLQIPSSRAAPQNGLSHHCCRRRPPRRQPRNHGFHRRSAARTPVRTHRRCPANDFFEHLWFNQRRPPVRFESRH